MPFGGLGAGQKEKNKKKLQAASSKLQAAWHLSWDIVGLINERTIMDKEINGHLYIANDNLKRIADILEEILRLVKKDMEDKWRK